MLPLLESLTRHFIFVGNQFEPPRWNPKVDIRNIQIKPLKRKIPEPKLPYREPYPTLNQNSEPNVELLTSAINISLKSFLSMEEEAFIFPSDVDAEVRALKARFGDALEVLGNYLKNKTKGRGMEVLSQVMDYAEKSNPLRLTNYNHEEDRILSEQVFAAIQEDVRKAFEEAKRLAEEEAKRIASEEEIKKLAEQEAMKVAMEMAVRIAEVEIEKITEEQTLVLHQGEDTIMTEQDNTDQASDKGKNVVVDSTPPTSPVRTLRESGAPSSTITPEMWTVFDGMQAQITDLKDGMQSEMAEIRADNKAKDEKMDQILLYLRELAERLPTKP
jgi:hypothetical protein